MAHRTSARLAALGAGALLSLPLAASAQGRCGGDRAGTPGCDTSAVKPPFASTGWKTVALDHFSMQAADYKKEAAYYATLMNWKILSDDGTKAVLGAGDVGRVIIRGGYQTPPPPPPPTAADSAAGRARFARPPRAVVWDGMAWVVSPWNAKKVEAALRERGLNPVADNDGKGYESFRVKDPDGFDVTVTNGGGMRVTKDAPAGAPLPAAAPFEKTAWKTVWLDHISFGVTDYKQSAAFYHALLGWTPTGDEGSQNEMWIGDLGNIIVRGGNPLAPGFTMPAQRRAQMDHVSFGINPWDTDGVKAELDKRGLTGRADTGGKGDIHDPAALYKSYHTTTPGGFDLQISNATKTNRTVR